ncbi:dephospho-CoA kinase [Desertihabitans brevis]|uniref:Dephospho-CoA kinase n=1 Tax=Desertihabitans brevis TaxID=2268447 RepID=A0A367YXX8_9ACTN|nr:dephospho-CoA kinase [Desertihabitans brevis]RCK70587.1 dephospho-CoA kinase [Desertihabitans brevis]
MTGRERIGLTGGIASGKSAAAEVLASLGAVIVDADLLAREVVEPGTPGLAEVVHRFGPGVLTADGALDRPALGRLVFGDERARRDLEAIIHPRVRALAAERERAAPEGAVVVQVIPLLVETGQQDRFDTVVVVDVDPTTQLRRLRERDGSDETAARARIAAQASREERLAAADVVWRNDGDRDALRRQVEEWWDSRERRPLPK